MIRRLVIISGVQKLKGLSFRRHITAEVLLVVKDFNHGILVNFKKLIQKKAPFKGCFLF